MAAIVTVRQVRWLKAIALVFLSPVCVCVLHTPVSGCGLLHRPLQTSSHGSTIATVNVLKGHLPLTGLFSSLMGDHLTLCTVFACEVNSLCLFFLLSVCAPARTKAYHWVWVCMWMWVYTRPSSRMLCALACRHQTPWFLLLLFLPMRQRGRWRKKISFDCLEMSVREHSYLGIIAFKYWDIKAKWAVEQREFVVGGGGKWSIYSTFRAW